MKIEELIHELKKIKKRQHEAMENDDCNFDVDHRKADQLLLEYIDNEEVTEIFHSIKKWYS